MPINLDLRTEQYKTTENLSKRANLHQRFNTNPQPWNEWIFTWLPLMNGDRVLDIGCGTGLLWLENLSRLPHQIHLTLTDRSFEMARTSKTALGLQAGCSVSQTDAQSLPFNDHSFNLVTANHMIFFIPNIHQALNEMKRVLRPGGWLTATTNGKDHMQALYDLVAQVKGTSINTLFGGDGQGPERFALENGAEILKETFEQVDSIVFRSDLKITAAQPLIDYIESLWRLTEPERSQLLALINAEIEQHGHFFIAKAQGLLLARKPCVEETSAHRL